MQSTLKKNMKILVTYFNIMIFRKNFIQIKYLNVYLPCDLVIGNVIFSEAIKPK
jgi:hypothetical protein